MLPNAGYWKKESETGGGGAENAFTIIQPDSGTSPTADSATDTLTLTSANANLTIVGDATTDTITFTVNSTAGNSFATIVPTAGTSPVADSATDSLTILNTDGFIAITGDATADSLTFAFDETQIDHTNIQNIGTNAHSAIDSHIASTVLHVPAMGVGTNGQWLTNNGTDSAWSALPAGLAVSGTDNHVVRMDGTTGLQDSLVIIDDAGIVTGITQLNVDNIRLDLNTISSTDTNGNLNLTPNGIGNLVLDGNNWPQAAGTTGYLLYQSGASQTSWGNPAGLMRFLGFGGDYSDGTVTYSSNTNLSSDIFADALTVDEGIIVNVKGFRIFARTTNCNGKIMHDGTSGNAGAAGVGITPGNGGAAPAVQTSAAISCAGINGVTGGAGGGSVLNGTAGTGGNTASDSFGAAGVAGGAGGTGGTGGSVGAGSGGGGGAGGLIASETIAASGRLRNMFNAIHWRSFPATAVPTRPVYHAGSGGGGGGGGGSNTPPARGGGGGGGGGSGESAGGMIICSEVINISATGTISVNGGGGGGGGGGGNAVAGGLQPAGGGAGGGGGGGGQGGYMALIYGKLVNSGAIERNGGSGGVGGAGGTGVDGGNTGSTGTDGVEGNPGEIAEYNLSLAIF